MQEGVIEFFEVGNDGRSGIRRITWKLYNQKWRMRRRLVSSWSVSLFGKFRSRRDKIRGEIWNMWNCVQVFEETEVVDWHIGAWCVPVGLSWSS